jgi:ComF family protein
MPLPSKTSEVQASSGLLAFIQQALDLVFPVACSGCGRVDSAWCARCERELAVVEMRVRERQMGGIPIAVTGVYAGKLEDAIQALKYDHVTTLAAPLGERLYEALTVLQWSPDVVIPIPLHRTRYQERGYNQSYLLAAEVAHAKRIPCLPDAVQRIRDTRTQVGLTRDERRLNVMNAFTGSKDQCSGKIVLIIDDVLTTGATLHACATAVLKAGGEQVYGLTVAAARD